ncbi:NUMOD4 motif-containing HNH endonuclease [Corynebacterium kalidii]|uniref:NUMOD4 motif-containing HNH endonuclease n=1 Tax=Corynebacterium kalidii TaxID=2931982 RepID=A0A9X1WHH6_9CORY|nr:NUMOD4 motif-containing HNH endonuclease [Corynebacterium kalidii]MCJ7859249.1 NUMOD4 motif-containing HNH endonuclease [Corynebacterium kalidii]
MSRHTVCDVVPSGRPDPRDPWSEGEIWKPIPGYEGYYEVSDQGRVKRVARMATDKSGRRKFYPERIKSPRTEKRFGYKLAGLSVGGRGKSIRVHRLVMAAFVGPCPEGMEVCHNNGDPADNRLVNLRYDTRVGNRRDQQRHGTDHEVNKTHCPFGHDLVTPNLRPWILQQGRRGCLACERARSYVKYHTELRDDFEEISDRYYGAIMGGAA